MKINLHCNLPSIINIPNPAIGYLKGYLQENNNADIENIYWNILPSQLILSYEKINDKESEFYIGNPLIYHIAKILFDNKNLSYYSRLMPLLESPFFQYDELKDFSNGLKEHFSNRIEQDRLYDVDLVGFTLKLDQWMFNYYILRKLKQYNPDLKTVIGGIISHSQALEYMKIFPEADYAIWGEGEIPFSRLIERMDNQSSYNEIPNLIYRKGSELITTKPLIPEDLPDINTYPFADHSDYFKQLERYQIIIPIQIPIQGSRSCWWNKCTFCGYNEKYVYRQRKPENIIDEIEFQYDKYKVNYFRFVDNDASLQTYSEFEKLLKLLLKSSSKKKSPYNIQSTMTLLRFDRLIIDNMQKIAIINPELGFEAVTDLLLKKMKKPQSFAHNIQALKLAKEQNFPLNSLNIIRGIPDETPEDVIESMQNLKFLRFLLKDYKLRQVSFILFKGAPYYKQIPQEEIDKNYNHSITWPEISSIENFKNANKREICGFSKGLENSYLWDAFRILLDKYKTETFTYKWFEYNDGTSIIEEYITDELNLKRKYYLDHTETKILQYCDTVKLFNEIKNQFTHKNENELKKILTGLKKAGLLYHDDEFKYHIISIVSTKYLNKIY